MVATCLAGLWEDDHIRVAVPARWLSSGAAVFRVAARRGCRGLRSAFRIGRDGHHADGTRRRRCSRRQSGPRPWSSRRICGAGSALPGVGASPL